MKSLSIPSLSRSTWNIYKSHWQVFLCASLVPFVFTLLDRFVFGSHGVVGSIVSLVTVVLGFLSYFYQTEYAIALSEGRNVHWKSLLRGMQINRIWRIIRTNIWMVVIIVWPMFVLVAAAGVLGFVISTDSFTGTTIALIAMGIAAVVGGIVSFIRSLSYTLMLYLAFTTHARVRTLKEVSRKHMMGHRIKLLKVVLLQILAGIVGAFAIVLLPVIQSLVYIMMVLFAERVVGMKSSHAEETPAHSQESE